MSVLQKLSALLRSCLLGAVVLSGPPLEDVTAGEIVAIVNKSQTVSHLSIKDLQLIYKGKKKTWDNGESIVLCLPPFGSEPMDFLVHRVFRINSEAEVSGFYLQAVFQQVFVNPPKSYVDARFAAFDVATIPGAIAIVDRDELPPDADVKIVQMLDEP